MAGDTPDFKVQGLLKELESLELPFHLESPIRENLDLIREINGTADPVQVMFKRILYGQAHSTIMHFRYVKDMQKVHLDGCPVNQLVHRDSEGRLIMPWEGDIQKLATKVEGVAKGEEAHITEEAAEEAKPQEKAEPESSLSVTLPWLGKFLQLRGKVAMIVTGWVLSMLTVIGSMYLFVVWNNKELRRERFADMQRVISQLATNGVIHVSSNNAE